MPPGRASQQAAGASCRCRPARAVLQDERPPAHGPGTTHRSAATLGPENLFLGQAFQQAVLLVDEDGTGAAAVTELGVEAVSAPVSQSDVELHLDRPFLLTIDHTETSWPLFLAAIGDPRH